MTLTRKPGPSGPSLTVRFSDGNTKTVHGRRAAIIRHLLLEAVYLDEPALACGKLEINWDDARKLDVNCTRFSRELWGEREPIRGISESVENAARRPS